MSADGSDPQNITNNQDLDIFPVWSPNGQIIAFTKVIFGDSSPTLQIFRMNADGSNSRPITSTETKAIATSWR